MILVGFHSRCPLPPSLTRCMAPEPPKKAVVRLTRAALKEAAERAAAEKARSSLGSYPHGRNLQQGVAPRSEYFKSLYETSSEISMGRQRQTKGGDKKRGKEDPEDKPIVPTVKTRGGDRRKRKAGDPWKGPTEGHEGETQAEGSVTVEKKGSLRSEGQAGTKESADPKGPGGDIETQRVAETEPPGDTQKELPKGGQNELPGGDGPPGPAESVANKPESKGCVRPPVESAVEEVAQTAPKIDAPVVDPVKEVVEKSQGTKQAELAGDKQAAQGEVGGKNIEGGVGKGRPAKDGVQKGAAGATSEAGPSNPGGIGSQEFFGSKLSDERRKHIAQIAQNIKDGKGGDEAADLSADEVRCF